MSRPNNRRNNIEIVIESQDDQSYEVNYTEDDSDDDQYTESNQLVTVVSEADESPQETEIYEEESSAEEEGYEEEEEEGEGSSVFEEESDESSSGGQDEIQIEIEGDFDNQTDNNINLMIELPSGFYLNGREGQVLNINIERNHHGQSDDENTEENVEVYYESEASPSEGEEYSESEQLQEVMVKVHTQQPKPLSAFKQLLEHPEDPPQTHRNAHQFSECSICFNTFHKHGVNSCYLECLHWFHFNCLSKWAHHKQECPVCRGAFNTIMKLK